MSCSCYLVVLCIYTAASMLHPSPSSLPPTELIIALPIVYLRCSGAVTMCLFFHYSLNRAEPLRIDPKNYKSNRTTTNRTELHETAHLIENRSINNHYSDARKRSLNNRTSPMIFGANFSRQKIFRSSQLPLNFFMVINQSSRSHA